MNNDYNSAYSYNFSKILKRKMEKHFTTKFRPQYFYIIAQLSGKYSGLYIVAALLALDTESGLFFTGGYRFQST